jgi:hypothetical protein
LAPFDGDTSKIYNVLESIHRGAKRNHIWVFESHSFQPHNSYKKIIGMVENPKNMSSLKTFHPQLKKMQKYPSWG